MSISRRMGEYTVAKRRVEYYTLMRKSEQVRPAAARVHLTDATPSEKSRKEATKRAYGNGSTYIKLKTELINDDQGQISDYFWGWRTGLTGRPGWEHLS